MSRLDSIIIPLSFIANIELKDVPKEEKSKMAKDLYRSLSAEDKERLEKEAKLAADVDVEGMAPEDVERCINHTMQRVMKEVQ